MDSKKPTKGRGQGSLVDMMRRRQEEQIASRTLHSLETPSSAEQTRSLEEFNQSSISTNVSLGRGRASLASKLLETFGCRDTELVGLPPSSAVSRGRGFVQHLSPPGQNEKAGPSRDSRLESSASMHKEIEGVLGKLSDVSVYDNPVTEDVPCEESKGNEPICRQGTSGQRINLFTNYIDLKADPNMRLYQYDVQYSPDIASQYLRRRLLNQHSETLGQTKIFDGMILFLPIKLPNEVTRFKSLHSDGSEITLVVVYRKTQKMNENVQFFNVLFNRVMRGLDLVRIGRQSFDPSGTHKFDSHRLEVWPGYVTAINEFEGGLKLCIDIKHRVLRTETVRDLIAEFCNMNPNTYRERAMNEIIGTSVLTRYNNKTYRIDDIAWDKTPKCTFEKNGEEISLIEYYERQWKIKIIDYKQPLLVHRENVKTSSGEKQERLTLLVPELSYAAGLTDNIRSNYKIMRELSTVTKTSPSFRRQQVQKFIKEIQSRPITRDVLAEWGLELSTDIVQLKARCLDPEEIVFGRNSVVRLTHDRPDWSNIAVKSPVLRAISLKNWHVIYWKKDHRNVNDFVSMIMNIVSAVKIQFTSPNKIELNDDKIDTYLRAITNSIDSGVQMVVIVFSTNRTDRYSAVKKLCCVRRGIPSQVIISKTLSNPGKLKSVTEKIALQMNCKLGGALWTVKMPLRNSMICGIDVYHSGVGGSAKKSVAGFVASMDSQLTKWHSRICIQASKQELVDMLQMCLISSLNAYKKQNGCNPDRIFIFRDGVGDGDLDYVENYEVKQLRATFHRIAPDYNPKLSMIVVQKRINTRFFAPDNRKQNELTNPSAGTIVDSCVTRRNYYDFFLIPQNTREGTVTPTHYIVLHDTSNMEPDHMQRLTYKLCHLYYNWPGTIRVPAPCQYAHKLVSLVGQNIQIEPHHSLSDLLYYL